VELERPCPFWKEEAQCNMEGQCTVCSCPEEEVPMPWVTATSSSQAKVALSDEDESDLGWISNSSFSSSQQLQSLGKISISSSDSTANKGSTPVSSSSFLDYSNFGTINKQQKSTKFFQNLYQTEDCDNFGELFVSFGFMLSDSLLLLSMVAVSVVFFSFQMNGQNLVLLYLIWEFMSTCFKILSDLLVMEVSQLIVYGKQ
jgi:hypothetical protein